MKDQSSAFTDLFTVDHTCPHPHPFLMGNGELVTGFGHTGYHTDGPNPGMQVFCLAGRRLTAPTLPLVRFGQLRRIVSIDGALSEETEYRQHLDPYQGILTSTLEHALLQEQTQTFVCLSRNQAVFKTTLTNRGRKRIRGEFALTYRFGDAQGALPSDCFLNISDAGVMHGMRMGFQIEQRHLGQVDLCCDREVLKTSADQGFSLTLEFALDPGESQSAAFVWGIGDKLRFRYNHLEWCYDDLLKEHLETWRQFHRQSSVSFGARELEAMREMCLYTLRVNSSPWSIPPAVSPSLWEGRTFHDELYPCLGLASAGHLEMAQKIPDYRLNTLGQAVARSAFRGAKYAWESAEDGGDGSPYGSFLEEHFHMGQFAEHAWQMCLYRGGDICVKRFYPMFREIADYFALNLVRYDEGGAYVRECTDYDEALYPVRNGLYTACAAIRSLEIAAQAGKLLGESQEQIELWANMAADVRKGLPRSSEENRYLTAADAKHRHVAEVGPIFPFRIDHSDFARRTLDSFCTAVRTEFGYQPGNLPNYGGSRWLWTTAHIATAYNLLGDTDRAYQLLLETPLATAPGLVPVEHIERDGSVALAWFTTSAGAYVFAVDSLFVQVLDEGLTRLPTIPSQIPDASFSGLLGADGLTFSASFFAGKARELSVRSADRRNVTICVSQVTYADLMSNQPDVTTRKSDDQWLLLDFQLKAGDNVFTARP